MFGLGGMEILIILVVGVVVLGPERLPKVMRGFTKIMSEFRRVSTDLQRTINTELNIQELNERQQREKLEAKKKAQAAGKKTSTKSGTKSKSASAKAGDEPERPKKKKKNPVTSGEVAADGSAGTAKPASKKTDDRPEPDNPASPAAVGDTAQSEAAASQDAGIARPAAAATRVDVKTSTVESPAADSLAAEETPFGAPAADAESVIEFSPASSEPSVSLKNASTSGDTGSKS